MSERQGQSRPAAGFTLVELLVVVAILALLISLLMPVLGRAKEITRRAICMTSQKSVGSAALMFSLDHSGRGPGRGHRFTPTGSSISWANILSMRDEVEIQRMGNEPKDRQLYCPSMRPFGGNLNRYGRAWKWNRDACGGPNWGGNARSGPYGEEIIPATNINPAWDFYALGAVLEAFPKAGEQYLMVPGERASDEAYGSRKTPPYSVEVGTDSAYAPYSTAGGGWAFRHINMTGNFLYIDGHVKTLDPSDPIDEKARYAYILD